MPGGAGVVPSGADVVAFGAVVMHTCNASECDNTLWNQLTFRKAGEHLKIVDASECV